MISLLIGLFLGVCITLLLYSTIVGERINNLEYQNERLMYLLALSEHLGFCLEEVYAAYMRKNAINMERLKNGY